MRVRKRRSDYRRPRSAIGIEARRRGVTYQCVYFKHNPDKWIRAKRKHR